ncbi:hypothetical protein EIP91_012434 [Steccherinum ochraceum]|uniref:Uncharacterized protein n=1 Tax=Steccherinum ochraceum TaxID=92696 RepID=A0A4R0RPX4_9APHY|nr:hypothetical protein EIP91_012434 [Steccherinum ochraceum]
MNHKSTDCPGASANKDKGPKDASAPFNNHSVNVILRTLPDHVDFWVRDAILMEASPFFNDMITLPKVGERRKHPESDDQEYRDGVPIIPVTEDSQTLDHLLRFCYPVADPEFRTAAEICKVLDAARKYLMDHAERLVLERFYKHVEREPLPLYALAIRHRWEKEIGFAAEAALRYPFPLGTFTPEMRLMDAAAYMKLQTYHAKCCTAASQAIRTICDGEEVFIPSVIGDDESSWWPCDDFAQWVVDYLEASYDLMKTVPHAEALDDSGVLLEFIEKGISGSCTACAVKVPRDVMRLGQVLREHVRVAVSAVKFELED